MGQNKRKGANRKDKRQAKKQCICASHYKLKEQNKLTEEEKKQVLALCTEKKDKSRNVKSITMADKPTVNTNKPVAKPIAKLWVC